MSMLTVSLRKYFPDSLANSNNKFALEVEFRQLNGLIVLFGASGAGKTSILRAISGLLCPDWGYIEVSGTIFYDSEKKINLPTYQRKIGYVFQNYGLFPHLNVRENIGFALNYWPRNKRRQRVEELVDLLALQDLIEQRIQSLSGGQSQRVAIARALAVYPKILLLDEPFSALDDDLKIVLRCQLKLIQTQFNIPIVLVTHSRADALELADYVVTMVQGKVTEIGQACHLLDSRSHSLPKNFQWG